MLDYEDFIAIGKITKPVGIKGGLKVFYLTDFPERFKKLEKVFLYNEMKREFHTNDFRMGNDFVISECRSHDDHAVLKFEGYDTINDSQKLVNLLVMINEKDRIKLKEGFYYYELVGLDVYDKDKFLGKVDKISNYGSGDLLSVIDKGKEILIPYRKEFVKEVDTAKNRIDVDLIEGFTE